MKSAKMINYVKLKERKKERKKEINDSLFKAMMENENVSCPLSLKQLNSLYIKTI